MTTDDEKIDFYTCWILGILILGLIALGTQTHLQNIKDQRISARLAIYEERIEELETDRIKQEMQSNGTLSAFKEEGGDWKFIDKKGRECYLFKHH